MLISRIYLTNWRNFRLVDVSIGKRVFVVGPNASGKSNFLDALRFLRDIAKPGGGLQEAVKVRGGISKIRCLAARRDPQIGVKVELVSNDEQDVTKWSYSLNIRQEERGHRQALVASEQVHKNDDLVLDRPDDNDKVDPLRLTQTHLEQINANKNFRDIAKFLESIYYLHLVPQLIRHPESFVMPGGREDPFGRSFLERVTQTPEKTRKSRLRKIETALQYAVPQLKQLTDTKDDKGIPHLEAVYEHWRPKAGKQTEDEFSDGTLRLIGFLWALLESDSLLLLEEPELSLHTAIIRKLPGLMWRIQSKKRRQIIISTHSADLLTDKGIDGREVLILTPSVEGTNIEVASEKSDISALLEQGFSVSEAVIPHTGPEKINQLNLDV